MLTDEALKEQLQLAEQTYKLNLGYLGLTEISSKQIDQIAQTNPHLIELELSSNKLSSIPNNIENLGFLRVLRVKYNNFEKIPNAVLDIKQLMVLEMSGNAIRQISPVINKCTFLKELDLSGNKIQQLPETLIQLPNLQTLSLSSNRIEHLPKNIGDFKSLIKLDISTNMIKYLPSSIGNLTKIQRIDCANNLLNKIPSSMGFLKSLKQLNVRYNQLEEQYRVKSEEGLSKLLVFLREEAERERLEEIERLKPVGQQIGNYMEYKCKADQVQKVKAPTGEEITVDNRCYIRTGHQIVQAGPVMVCFGGYSPKLDSKVNHLYWISLDRLEWHLQQCTGDVPVARDGHCMQYDPVQKRCILFGGRSKENKRLQDLYFLETDKWVWHKAPYEGQLPSVREWASSAIWNRNMIIFGGQSIGNRVNDIFLLDLDTFSWSQMICSGTAPSPRQDAALCVAHNHFLFVHGGKSNFVLDDLFMLDLQTRKWIEITSAENKPAPLYQHIMCTIDDFMYAFGGFNSLGSQVDQMYKVKLNQCQITPQAKLEWIEVDTELQPLRHRSYLYNQNTLQIFQPGTSSQVKGDDDVTKNITSWDIFKITQVQNLVQVSKDMEKLKQNPKQSRIQHIQENLSSQPPNFTQISPKEQIIIDFLEDFTIRFRDIYPQRRPVYLTPQNECGVNKFVCTTLKPTKLPYKDLYEYQQIAYFITNFLVYEPLENYLHPPKLLCSPVNTLQWQAGDSFDISMVLCSLLLGVGYDAYVVMGYAPYEVIINDQSKSDCPLIERENQEKIQEIERIKEQQKNSQNENTKDSKCFENFSGKSWQQILNSVLKIQIQQVGQSKYLQLMEQKKQQQIMKEKLEKAKDELQSDFQTRRISEDEQDPNALRNTRLVHAWIIILAGKREIQENIFIEPASGRVYKVNESPYTGVEFVWNQNNYWICMQSPEPHSDSRADPKTINWNLTNNRLWENVIAYDAIQKENLADQQLVQEASISENMLKQGLNKSKSQKTLAQQEQEKKSVQITQPQQQQQQQQQQESTEFEFEKYQPYLLPYLPFSWVPKISVPLEVYDMRCPRGYKCTAYNKQFHELFAKFSECARYDGMLERLTIYQDDQKSSIQEIREYYQRRTDRLRERVTYPQLNKTIEKFDPGSDFSIRSICTIKNEIKDTCFYSHARLDSLKQRVETVGKKLLQYYDDRDDFMYYQSVKYASPKLNEDMALQEQNSAQSISALQSKALQARKKKYDQDNILPIASIRQKFSRNTQKEAHEDVSKRSFLMQEHMIIEEYHYGDNKVTQLKIAHNKNEYGDNINQKDAPNYQVQEYLHKLIQQEKEAISNIRSVESETKQQFSLRGRQEQNISLMVPYYDVMRMKARELEEEREVIKEVQHDFLLPFLPPHVGNKSLNREEALKTRESCLKALKDRLIQRANIIQERYDEETAQLNKRLINYQRDRDQMTPEQEQVYEKKCEESLFRIHILENRLNKHEEYSLQKYQQLDIKLRNDPRLAILTEPTSPQRATIID